VAALDAARTGAIGPDRAVTVRSPAGAAATATLTARGTVLVSVRAGDPLDDVVLRSYAVGAAHQALGWVRSEGVAVDETGVVLDLTIRSFGIIPARAMPAVEVTVDDDAGPPLPAGDTVFAAVAAAAWLAAGLPSSWPVDRGGRA
jgi:CO/xanthine dehydrogenase Mo-binding subunit